MTLVTSGYTRVWWSEDVPEAAFEATASIEDRVPGTTGRAPVATARRAVVKTLWEVGGLPQRTLLGGVVQPATDQMLTVRVDSVPWEVATTGASLDGALGKPMLVGLPTEYSAVILEELLSLDGGPRRAVIDRAAHHVEESSWAAFRGAARLLGYVLEHGQLPDADHLDEVSGKNRH